MRFSANLGFLFTDRPLPDAVRAAAQAGFDAVECHWPYDTPVTELRAALDDTGLPLLSLNTAPGNSFGLAAMPDGRAARDAIDQAIAYAHAVGARMVHVMAGTADGAAAAESRFRDNLAYACAQAAPLGLSILIEPINTLDVPGYHLSTLDHAAETIAAVDAPNLKIMFDCYHVQIMHGALKAPFAAFRPLIGHVQFAALPDRGAPDHGDVDYQTLLPALMYEGYFGAEYRPAGDSFAWLSALRDAG